MYTSMTLFCRNIFYIMGKTHGMKWTKIYNIWAWMKKRCDNEKNHNFKYYWARWITYSLKWKKFEWFFEDMWETYQEWLSIDRIDTLWNYEKSNCRWVILKEQNRNRTNNLMFKWKCLKHWCYIQNLKYTTVYMRIQRWMSFEKALEL